jgi:hypothetical protein
MPIRCIVCQSFRGLALEKTSEAIWFKDQPDALIIIVTEHKSSICAHQSASGINGHLKGRGVTSALVLNPAGAAFKCKKPARSGKIWAG